MSTFRVNLRQGDQGNLDVVGTSKQRTVYIMGPNKINRQLKDGDEFTDSNYFKRYCYPTVAKNNAILEIVSDDGSVYVDTDMTLNSFPLSYEAIVVTAGQDYEDNDSIDLEALYGAGAYASYCQIVSNTNTTKVKLNGTAAFDVPTTTVQVFNPGDIKINKLEFKSTGGSTVDILLGVVVPSLS